MVKKIIQYAVSFGLMVFFLHWAFGDQDLDLLWEALSDITVQWIVLITAITIGTLYIRAWRWTVLMRPFAPQVTAHDAALALAICYASNVVIPRSGEVLRSISLKWTRNVSLSPVIATVVVERIMDMFWLIVYIGLAIFLQREAINNAFPSLEMASLIVLVLCLVALVGLLLISVYQHRAIQWLEPFLKRFFPIQLAEKALGLLTTFLKGLASLQNPFAYLELILSSLLLNTGYVLIIFATFAGMGLSETYGLGFPAALVIMAISSLGVVVPTPGGMGSYHVAFALPLQQIYHLPETSALACATLAHALATLTYLLLGGPALLFQWLRQRRG
jgi:uncharacterized protein (TIRG00374 family)